MRRRPLCENPTAHVPAPPYCVPAARTRRPRRVPVGRRTRGRRCAGCRRTGCCSGSRDGRCAGCRAGCRAPARPPVGRRDRRPRQGAAHLDPQPGVRRRQGLPQRGGAPGPVPAGRRNAGEHLGRRQGPAGADLPLPARGDRGGQARGEGVRRARGAHRPRHAARPRRPGAGRVRGGRRRDRPEVVRARGRGRHRLERLPQEPPRDRVPARRLLAHHELPRRRRRAGAPLRLRADRAGLDFPRDPLLEGAPRQVLPGAGRPRAAARRRRLAGAPHPAGGGGRRGEGPRAAAARGRRGRPADRERLRHRFEPQPGLRLFAAGRLPGRVRGRVGGARAFKNILGLAIDRDENLFVVDAGAGRGPGLHPAGAPGPPRRPAAAAGRRSAG